MGQDGGRVGRRVRRQTERPYLDQMLARDAQPLAAGHQQVQPRCGSQQRDRELGGGVEQVLAVVQDEQQMPVPQMADDDRDRVPGAAGRRAVAC
jgi:hypothetical protein